MLRLNPSRNRRSKSRRQKRKRKRRSRAARKQGQEAEAVLVPPKVLRLLPCASFFKKNYENNILYKNIVQLKPKELSELVANLSRLAQKNDGQKIFWETAARPIFLSRGIRFRKIMTKTHKNWHFRIIY